MREEWTGELIGKMHVHNVTAKELATELGWCRAYVSMILTGKRNPFAAREKLEEALDDMIRRKGE